MRGSFLLSLFLCGNVFGMDSLEVRFVEATSPMMLERVRNFEVGIYQALVDSEAMSCSKCVVENVLRFFRKNRKGVESDAYLCVSICEYIMHAGVAFAGDEVKQKKLQHLVADMILIMAGRGNPSAFEKFYKLFSDRKTWISEPDSKFAAYAMLAFAAKSTSLSMYDVNLIDELSRLNQESDSGLNAIMQDVVKSAPFLVGVYYDVRPDKDTLMLKEEQCKKIVDFLKDRLSREEVSDANNPVQAAFKTAVLTL